MLAQSTIYKILCANVTEGFFKRITKNTNKPRTLQITRSGMLMLIICQSSSVAIISGHLKRQLTFTLSMLSKHLCFTFNPSETIRLVSPSLLTASLYFTSFTSRTIDNTGSMSLSGIRRLGVATDKIIHWLSYIGTTEL